MPMSANAVSMGIDGILNLASAMAERNFAKARSRIRDAEIAANKVIQAANNEAKAKYGTFNRYKESLAKQLQAKNFGNVQQALATNLVNTQDSSTAVRQALGIQQAEAEGALSASIATSGLTGGTAEALTNVSALRFANRAAQFEKARVIQDTSSRNQLDAMGKSFVGSQGLDYNDDNLSFAEEMNMEVVPSMGMQLFKAVIKTMGKEAPDFSNMMASNGRASTSTKSGFKFDVQPQEIPLPQIGG